MLNPAAKSPSVPSPIILDLSLDNWATFHQAFKSLCFTKFCVAGSQILSDCAIPLSPFAHRPTKSDLDLDDNSLPIPDHYTYARRAYTPTEAALPGFSVAALSLTESGNREYREDVKLFTAAERRF